VRIRDKVDVDQLVGHFADGATIKELAASYGISESSVKRLLRACGARRL
jgi:DNA-binding transcriptional regulator LsrR (DeoR family)